jgi:hypothetical protein
VTALALPAAWSVPRRRTWTAHRWATVTTAAALAGQPLLQPAGPGNSSPVDVLTVLAIVSVGAWSVRNAVPVRAPYLVGAGLLIVGGAVAGMVGPLPGAALLALVQDVVLVLWCAAVATLADRGRRLQLLASAWAYGAVASAAILLMGVLGHVSVITGVVEREGNRVMFTFGDPNYAGLYWVMSLFLVYATGRPHRRSVRVVGYALLLTALALSESNGGVVALGVGLAAVFVIIQTRRRGALGGIAAALSVLTIVGALTVFVPFSAVQTWARDSGQPLLVNSVGRSDSSSAQRSLLIQESTALYQADGWQGSGPASTKDLLTNRGYPYAKEAHDDYLAALTERGPIGLLGLLVVIAAAVARARVVARTAARADELKSSPLPHPAGLVAALLAAAVAGGYYEVMHFRFVWAALALVAAFAGSQARERRAVGNQP